VLTEDLTMRAAAAGRRAGEAAGARPGAPAALETVLAGFSRADTARRLLDQEILGRAAATIDVQLDGEPLIAARLLETISSAYRNLGFYDAAADHARRALAIRRARLGEDARDTLATLRSLGIALYYAVRFAEAETVLREALERQRRVLGPEDPLTLATQCELAVVLHDQNRLEDALALHEPALRAQRRILGRHDEAERLATEAFDGVRGARGEEHADTAVSMHNLGRIHHDAGRHEEAARWFERALEIRRRVIGEDAVATLYTMNGLAENYIHLGRNAEAERLHREVLERGVRAVGEEHPAPRDALGGLGRLAAAAGRHDEARRLRARHLGIVRRVADARSGDPGIKNQVAALLLESADATAADRRDALAYAMAAAEESGRSDPEILETLARAHAAVGDAARARETVRAALALLRADDQVVRERLLGIIGGDKPVDGPAGGKTGPSRP
jgi:tetratricopeptide (TPR) repeat protein